MKQLKFVILFLLVILSLMAGFLSDYAFVVSALISLVLFNAIPLFIKSENGSLQLKFLGVSLLSFVLCYHIGLLVKANLRQVCYEGLPKNFKESTYNLRPIDLNDLDQRIATFSDFKIDTLRQVKIDSSVFYIKKLTSKNKIENKTKILIVAGTHGSETANVYATLAILERIKSQNLLSDFHFEIIYALNPVGLLLFYRFNECNCNVNLDFITFKTVQAQILRDLVTEKKFDCVFDLHEGPYDGQYVINNTSHKNLNKEIISELEKNKISVSPMLKNRVKDFIFQYELDNPIAKLKKISTFDMYLKSKGIENILSESDGLGNDFEKRIQGHVIVFDKLIEAIKAK